MASLGMTLSEKLVVRINLLYSKIMRKITSAQESFAEKGRQIYYQLKPMLEKKYSLEDYVSIDVETGDYQIDETGVGAILKSKRQYPKKKFFLAQVGRIAGMFK